MTTKPKQPTPDDPEQLKRFREMAREVEVDEREGAFDRAFERVKDTARAPKLSEDRSRRSEKRSSS